MSRFGSRPLASLFRATGWLVPALLLTATPLFAVTFTVNTTADTVDAALNGTCADSSGNCSVRAAIQEANNTSGATVSIPAGTYTLTRAGAGEDNAATGDLDIFANMTIAGAGANLTIIDANGIDRVFHIRYTGANVTMQDLAITGGDPGTGNGGGILCVGQVTVLRCDISSNRAGSNLGSEGGGFYLSNGSASFVSSTLRNNYGALRGGAIANFCAVITITNSTLSGNTVEVQGANGPTGGAIAHTCSSSQTWLNNVTIANNTAPGGVGGGIYNIGFGGGGIFEMRNTIVDGNTAGSSPDIDGPVTSMGYNLIGNTSGTTVTATTGDQFNTSASLAALANNGGGTMTHSIPSSSPAFNGGDPAGCKDQSANVLTDDQRGVLRPQAGRCDIGAFEQDVFASADLAISKTGGAAAVAGQTVTYTFSVDNNGTSAATGVTVTDTPPAGMTFSSGTGGCASGFPWVIGNLATPGNATCTATFNVASSMTAGNVDNVASVAGNEYDPTSTNDSSTATTTISSQVDLQVTVAESIDPVSAGSGSGNLTYTVTVKNNGPSDATGVALSNTLTLPSGVSIDSITPSQGSFSDPTWTVGSLVSGASATLTVTLTAASTTAPGTDVIADSAAVTATNESPINTGDDSDSEATSVVSPATVTATKRVTGGNLFAGSLPPGTVTYTVVLSNAGPGTQQDNTGDEFTDVLPAGLTLVSASASSGTVLATVATNTVTWNGSISPAGTVTITINATVKATVQPGDSISNQGTASYDSDGDGTNDATAQTQGPSGGATVFAALAVPSVPTLDLLGLALLGVLLASIALIRQ